MVVVCLPVFWWRKKNKEEEREREMCGEKMTAAEAGNQGYGGVAHTLVESAVSKTKAAGKKRGKKKDERR